MFRINNLGISPVVATALLLVVAVVGVLGFNTWFNSFQSNLNAEVETKSSNSIVDTGIVDYVNGILYFSGYLGSEQVSSLKVNGKDCELNTLEFENSSSMVEIDISICVYDITESILEVVLVTSDAIYNKVFYVGSDSLNPYLFVFPSSVRLVVDSFSEVGLNTYDISGHAEYLSGNYSNFSLVLCQHTDIYYCSKYDGAFDSNFGFSLNGVAINTANTDRVVFGLVTSDFAFSSYGCNAFGDCSGTYDILNENITTYNVLTGSKFSVPFFIDGNKTLGFDSVYLLRSSVHVNSLIQNLQKRVSKLPLGSNPSLYFVKSFLDSDQYYVYDQALAIMAFSHAGLQSDAQGLINALEEVQNGDGSFYFSYNYDGTSIYPGGGNRRISGAIAWVAMALNSYKLKFGDNSYDSFTESILNYLNSTRVDVNIDGNVSKPVPFGPSNLFLGPTPSSNITSFEHNLDSYSAFKYYGQLSGKTAYTDVSSDIRTYLESLWDNSSKHFYVGYNRQSDQKDSDYVYLDTQSWGVLSLGVNSSGNLYDFSLGVDYNCDNFYYSQGFLYYRFGGVFGFYDSTYLSPQKPFVWSEGTLGQVLAMNKVFSDAGRVVSCNGKSSNDFLVQMQNLVVDGGGICYATYSENPDFFSSSSIAGTTWLYFAEVGFNPFMPSFS